jgi:hypothetical protein
MDMPTLLLMAAAILGGVAVFLHVLGKEKHRLERAYQEQRKHIAKQRQYEENLRHQMEETRQKLAENAPNAVREMARQGEPPTPPRRPQAAPQAAGSESSGN